MASRSSVWFRFHVDIIWDDGGLGLTWTLYNGAGEVALRILGLVVSLEWWPSDVWVADVQVALGCQEGPESHEDSRGLP